MGKKYMSKHRFHPTPIIPESHSNVPSLCYHINALEISTVLKF
jgi:hypothetical protein